jgi:dienelactone hydrolase
MRQSVLLLVFCLAGVEAAAGADLAKYSGNYLLRDGQVIAIAEWELSTDAPHILAFTNLETGRFGALTPATENEFTLNAGLLSGPVVATIHFEEQDGHVVGLQYRSDNPLKRRARRIPIRSEAVTIRSGEAVLGGTLYMPAGKGPFPAVVLVPAGRLHRTATATFPNFFLSQGLAVLAYDRRKETASFETYARDAVAAVAVLRAHKRIDAKRVGLWGHSQGGWLSLVGAAVSDTVSFVISHSGMLVPAWRQELYRLEAEALADGMDPREVSGAVAFEAELMHVAQAGSGWEELEARLKSAEKGGWIDLVYKPASLEELQSVWENDFSFDPREWAGRVHQPVLALFGGLDQSTPIESAANLIRARQGRPGLTVRFFPTANHAFLEAITGGNAEIMGLSRFAPGMFEEMRRWLRETLH